MPDEFVEGAIDGLRAVSAMGLGVALAMVLSTAMTTPYIAITACVLVILGALARLGQHFSVDPALRPVDPRLLPPPSSMSLDRAPDERVHVMNAVGLILLMALWILLVLGQFVTVIIGGILVMLAWRVRLFAHRRGHPRLSGGQFGAVDETQTRMIAGAATFVLIMALALLIATSAD